jgi:preprotein translocase subunit SecE
MLNRKKVINGLLAEVGFVAGFVGILFILNLVVIR